MHMVDTLEDDAVFHLKGAVPFWMTRFDLFSDSINEPEDYHFKFNVIYQCLDGKHSVLEIADELNTTFEKVLAFIRKMESKGLVGADKKPFWKIKRESK